MSRAKDQKFPRPTKDHVTPRSRGGKGLKNNIVMCCYGCNQDKGSRTLDEYRRIVAHRKGLSKKTYRFFGEDNINTTIKKQSYQQQHLMDSQV